MKNASTSLWFLYVVQCNDESLYTGVTTNVSRRIHEHNKTSRGAKYTRSRRPVCLVYQENHGDRSLAQKAEHQFRKLTRIQKEKVIKESHSQVKP